ncbi:MAG: Asp-tRNA(Asn)/Glu-tRNA(Gln) amidotransferase GatCAB subunit C [Candidatus Ryanbacteria bacterium CG10_big_fil_rev_8_21_14_0_10_43_42]|uniref:Asp-tRNA(Asn)/Glu-tRNA(Gln) amidotransferase GatCAB subunit C n=1 Tax=Candidatus Ryanbacteria bacterium CG10_big_fil_rev_8_21_14_0_10_43_42 TaxID=1974864 RepID=A0A2M8KYG0_9BACT|nr:MAG: Asp-tRNA(Asn)/Glu-tRNA(Gln) amidotransferase GatCAB subunit C [Candidatus Ryanbacteria bacterium CG10_big_fil_rev_8_21_14_0_10_43_42]
MKNIHHISELARIDLTETEEKRIGADLEHILAYVDKLKNAETGGGDELIYGGSAVNVFREDEEGSEIEGREKELIIEAPDHDGTFIKVKSVLKK